MPEQPSPKSFAPRARFLQNPTNIRQHGELIELPSFQRAVETAMAEFTRAVIALSGEHNLNEQGTEQASSASFHMIQGANHFIGVLYRLADAPEPPRKKEADPDVLDQTS